MDARPSPRVLLVHPSRPRERTYPLGLACLAAVAKSQGCQVVGIDLRLHPLRTLLSTLQRLPFDYVGITSLSTTIDEAAALVRLVRSVQPTAFVVIGGAHATLAPRATLARTRADAVVRGDGEEPFATLLAGRLDGPGVVLRGADGLAPIHVHADLDTLPPPDRLVFPVDPYYREGILGTGRRTAVVATRGCRLDCGYCSAKASSLGVFRAQSVSTVVDEIRRLRHDHDLDAIVFEDDNLLLDTSWCQRLFEALARDVPGMRYDLPNGVHPALIDEATINLMRRAGVRSLAFGVESTHSAEQLALGRTFDLARLERVCRHARNVGIITTGYVLVGLPGQSVWSAMSQMRRLRALPFDMLHVSLFLDLPGQPVPGLRSSDRLGRWTRVRRALYAAWYADPRRAVRVLKLAGGDKRALGRLTVRALTWWR